MQKEKKNGEGAQAFQWAWHKEVRSQNRERREKSDRVKIE